ncbi:MAG: HEPN domain-containing protein [Paludibacteraceae bacterium]|nr:HEPN domain-containing protein [Paludibacteraceae bacterium]
MSKLQDKSELNFSSARLLHDKNFYPPVAHCSYYGCFQLIKHVWLNSFKKTDDDLKALIDSLKKGKANQTGSHEVLINQISTYIKSKKEVDYRDFNSSILQLKKLRTTSDYDDVDFDCTKSSKCLQLSEIIRPILKKY